MKSNSPEEAALVFDSMAMAVSGLRSSGAAGPRCLVYETAGVAINVMVQDDGTDLVLTGQLVDSATSEAPTPRPVALMRGDQEVATMQCDEYGEFHGEFRSAADLWLQFTDSGGTVIVRLPQSDRL